MKMSDWLEKNGVTVQNSQEFQSFVTKINQVSYSLHITVPSVIRRAMELKPDELLLVAIRRIDKTEAIEEYGYSKLKPRMPSRSRRALQVRCPVCGKDGSLTPFYKYLYVNHRKKHGFEKPIVHYISRWNHPDFYKKYESSKGNDAKLGEQKK